MGKTRVIAETGAGQHGVATATAAALFGLECVVYMGEEDTRRQALNVARMRLLGAEVVPVDDRQSRPSRTRSTRPCATGWPTSRRTHYLLGTVAGPHPFPTMVRDFQRIIGDEARAAGARAGRPAARRRRGLRRRRVQRDGHLHRVHRRRRRSRCSASRPAATASTPAGTPPRSPAARRACCTAPGPTCCRTRTARPMRDALDLGRPGLPGRRPGARLAARHRPRDLPSRSPTPRRWRRSACCAAPRASSRRSRRAHALAGALRRRPRARAATADRSWSTSPAAATRTSTPRPAGSGWSRRGGRRGRAATRGRSAGGGAGEPARRRLRHAARGPAALVGYLPAGFPSYDGVGRRDDRDGRRRRRRRRGRPAVLRPADGRPGDPGGRRGALRARAPAISDVLAHRARRSRDRRPRPW